MKNLILFIILASSFSAYPSIPVPEEFRIAQDNFDKRIKKAISDSRISADFNFSADFDYDEALNEVRQRLIQNQDSLELHTKILEELQSDPIIVVADVGTVIAGGYLAYGLYSLAMLDSGAAVIGATELLTSSFTLVGAGGVLAADLMYLADLTLSRNFSPEAVLASLKKELNDLEKLVLIQFLNLAVKKLDSDFDKSLDFKWYDYLLRSKYPFKNAIQIRKAQINLDTINFELLKSL